MSTLSGGGGVAAIAAGGGVAAIAAGGGVSTFGGGVDSFSTLIQEGI